MAGQSKIARQSIEKNQSCVTAIKAHVDDKCCKEAAKDLREDVAWYFAEGKSSEDCLRLRAVVGWEGGKRRSVAFGSM